MAVTLFELQRTRRLPHDALALFIMDLFVARLTGQVPVTEPSCAGSSGVFDCRTRNWSVDAIRALGLAPSIFPDVREANQVVSGLIRSLAVETGLPVGVPINPPIGDHQASYVGSVRDRRASVLVNVGTGAQVAVFTDGLDFNSPIELRPFPCGGNLLSNVGLAGGWSYQVLEQFFLDVGRDIFQQGDAGNVYDRMNELARQVAPGADGLKVEPTFSGTRLDATVRGSITGISPKNFSSKHLCRAILEGMGNSLSNGFQAIREINDFSPKHLIAAGNGLRKNKLLAEIVSQNFGLPMTHTNHQEEAAFGAVMVSSVAACVFPDLDDAARQLLAEG
jgi:sugar (pentulose or hexulose) kinase